jgi:uncharacterized coiled-coil protein SlyX
MSDTFQSDRSARLGLAYQTRIDDLTSQNSEFKATIATLNTELATQIKATHTAEKHAAATEATASTQASQITDLQSTIEQLRAELSTIRTPAAAKPKKQNPSAPESQQA